jgi:hypothetical protein
MIINVNTVALALSKVGQLPATETRLGRKGCANRLLILPATFTCLDFESHVPGTDGANHTFDAHFRASGVWYCMAHASQNVALTPPRRVSPECASPKSLMIMRLGAC